MSLILALRERVQKVWTHASRWEPFIGELGELARIPASGSNQKIIAQHLSIVF